MVYVLDACALLAFLNDEAGGDITGDLLKKAADGECTLAMSVINLMEVHYGNIRTMGVEKAVDVATAMESSGQFVSSDHHELEIIAQREPVPFLWLPARPKK